MGKEPKCSMARKPDPLYIIQDSLRDREKDSRSSINLLTSGWGVGRGRGGRGGGDNYVKQYQLTAFRFED